MIARTGRLKSQVGVNPRSEPAIVIGMNTRRARKNVCMRDVVLGSFLLNVVRFARGRALFASGTQRLFHFCKIVVREPVELHEIIAGLATNEDQFVELEMNLAGVAILCVLNQENHQERDYRASRLDDKLPGG
jgi:hypothetical protein